MMKRHVVFPKGVGKERRLDILERSLEGTCLVNRQWCFAITSEPAVKSLIKKGFVVFYRSGIGRSRNTRLQITEAGKAYLTKNREVKYGRRQEESREASSEKTNDTEGKKSVEQPFVCVRNVGRRNDQKSRKARR